MSHLAIFTLYKCKGQSNIVFFSLTNKDGDAQTHQHIAGTETVAAALHNKSRQVASGLVTAMATLTSAQIDEKHLNVALVKNTSSEEDETAVAIRHCAHMWAGEKAANNGEILMRICWANQWLDTVSLMVGNMKQVAEQIER